MNEVDDEGLTQGPGPDPLAGFSQRRRRGVLVTSAAVAALGLSLGGAAVAGAASTAPASASGAPSGARGPMGGSPPAAMGTVASVGDGTFTLTTKDKTTVTVTVSSSTTYRDPGVTSPTLANVTVGEHVAVFGTDTANVVTATSVAIGNPPNGKGWGGPGGSPPAAMGTVASVGDGTFTLTTKDKTTVTVTVSSSTTYRDPGVTSPTLANVTVGEHVAVFGTDTANVVTATSVAIGNPPNGAGPGGQGRHGAPPTAGSGGSA